MTVSHFLFARTWLVAAWKASAFGGNSELLDRRVAESGLSTLARAKLRLGNSPTADYPKGAAEACAQRTKADVTLGLLISASFVVR